MLAKSYTLWSKAVAAASILSSLSSPRSRLIGSAMSLSSSGRPPPASVLRGVFVGSGSDGMSDSRIAQEIMGLLSNNGGVVNKTPVVLYLGTATYDLPQFYKRQTECLAQQGCEITSLNLVDALPPQHHLQESVQRADIIVVGGGNTLFAMDRWTCVGLVPLLQQAMERGAILTGGSAGAICWFDGGHSDSMDSDTYQTAMLQKFGGSNVNNVAADESSNHLREDEEKKDWKYIRVPGLGFLPGLLCPHHDKIQSNGVLRAHDFDQMLLKHPGEIGIGIDHWAALVVERDEYHVVSLENKTGSVIIAHSKDNTPTFSNKAQGVPGIWIKTVQNGKVSSRLCPPKGKLSDILQVATKIIQDQEEIDQCRLDNPDKGPKPY